MSDKHYVGLDVTSFEDTGKHDPVSRVTLFLDDENYYTAGDDTGKEITASCPSATQAMADALLMQLKGYQHQSFNADAANIDPAAELGDGVTVGGIYAGLSQIKDDGYGYSDISAPDEPEVEDEYPYISPIQQEINRKSTEIYSTISKTSEEIRLEINGIEQEQASMSLTLDGLETRITGAEDELASMTLTLNGFQTQINGKINGSEAQSLIDQSIDKISLSVSSANGSTTFVLKDGETTLTTQTLNLNVNAANITGTLSASQINMTGAITWSDLSSGVQTEIDDAVDTADTAYSMAKTAKSTAADLDDIITEWSYVSGKTTYIDGEMIMAGTIIVDELYGDTIYLYDDAGRTAGTITTEGATSTAKRKIVINSGGLELTTSDGNIFMEAADSEYLHIKAGYEEIVCGLADFVPSNTSKWDLGNSSKYWDDIYAVNCACDCSDLAKKHNVIYDISKYDAFFDALRPISFSFDSGTSGRTHIGLGAQDVEQALLDCGLTSMDFAGLVKAAKKDDEGNEVKDEFDYFLRYGEFISLLIEQVQKLKARVARLEGAA